VLTVLEDTLFFRKVINNFTQLVVVWRSDNAFHLINEVTVRQVGLVL